MDESELEIYAVPNPANDEFMISTSQLISEGTILVYDQAGKLMMETSMQENKTAISTAHLPNGAYTVRVLSEGLIANPVKLIVLH